MLVRALLMQLQDIMFFRYNSSCRLFYCNSTVINSKVLIFKKNKTKQERSRNED